MIYTFAWKETREHRAIWLTMAILTVVLGIGLGKLISANDPRAAIGTAAVTILGLAAVYGVVCGAMMFAGEQETGTLVFLDVFLGSRAKLWFVKFFLGALFVLTQAFTVAGGLFYLEQAIPDWGLSILGLTPRQVFGGRAAGAPTSFLWFFILPAITLEAYAWGILGSALSRRVLAGAAIAALAAAPVWLISVFTPPTVFLGFRIVVALLVLGVSLIQFIVSLGQTPLGASPPQERSPNRRHEFIDRFERLARDDWESADYEPIPAAILVEEASPLVEAAAPAAVSRTVPPVRKRESYDDAGSPFASLLWLSFQQAWAFVLVLLGVCLVLGMFLPFRGQIVWPLATLLIGVACGTATFGPEQRDLSYQFLSAQHFPLQTIWRFKVVFWFGVALLAIALFVLGGGIALCFQILLRSRQFAPQPFEAPHFRFGTLRHILGPVLYFAMWVVHGFVAGHLFVWLCRKMLLALALSVSAAAIAIALWLPSLLCGGMAGWQTWFVPVTGLVAAALLVRAWASGRIKDRRPLALLFASAGVILLWVAVVLAIRTWTLPNVGAPLDRVAFRAAIPPGLANAGGQKMQEALSEFRAAPFAERVWLDRLVEANRLPLGVIETPPGDGQALLLRHLPDAESMAERLRDLAQVKRLGDRAASLKHLSQILLLSRSLRVKAPLESYLTGIKIEEIAFEGFDNWFAGVKPNADQLRTVLDELKRHAAETPPPLECLQTECFRAGGVLANPNAWNFANGPTRLPEPWLVNGVAVSLDLPWETERSERIWRLVWAGLFTTMETPFSQLPASFEPPPGSPATQSILRGWLPAKNGPTASWSAADVASLLDASWLADERLFTLVLPLRFESTRSRWRTDAAILKTALALYQVQEGKNAPDLAALTPKYLPSIPVDPYTGAAIGYRLSAGENIPQLGPVQPGQPILWCSGSDRVNDGGRNHGNRWSDDNPQWFRGRLDLIAVVPMWK